MATPAGGSSSSHLSPDPGGDHSAAPSRALGYSGGRSLLDRSWPPDAVAVEAARDGDRATLTLILSVGVPKLIAFYRGMGFSTQDAEDLTSETCESIVRHLPRLRNPHTFEAWFWRIARNKFHDHLRRRKRTPRPRETEVAHDGPEDKMVIEAEHESVRSALLELPPRDRELLWLRDVAGLPYGDIAGRYGATSGAVRIAVMRARRRLEEALGVIEAG